MKTLPVQDLRRPSSARVKKQEHLAFSGVAHGSSVKPPKIWSSSSNRSWGVAHSSDALEKCTLCGGGAARAARATSGLVVFMALIMRAKEKARKVKGR